MCSTRKVSQSYGDLANDSIDLNSVKGTFKTKKKILLKSLESKADGRRHHLESTLASYYNTVMYMYAGLVEKIPKKIQDMLINDYLAISENTRTSPNVETLTLVNARPSEVAAIEALPKRREMKSRKCKPTPRGGGVIEVIDLENEFLTSDEKPLVTLTKKKVARSPGSSKLKKTLKRSTENSAYSPHSRIHIPDSASSMALRSRNRNNSSNEGSTRSIRKMPEKSSTQVKQLVAGSARSSRNASSTSASIKKGVRKSTSSGHGRVLKGQKSSAKTPLTQQQRINAKTPSFGAYTLVTPGYKLRTRTRPDEKIMVLSKDACPLVESQPTIICPLEDGSALTISSDTDFKSLTISDNVMENLKNFQRKLCSFLNLPNYVHK